MNDSNVIMTVEEYLVLDRASEDVRYEYIDGFGPSDVVELKSINVTVPIAAFYENVRF